MAYLEAAGGCSLLALGKPQAVDKSEDAQSARWPETAVLERDRIGSFGVGSRSNAAAGVSVQTSIQCQECRLHRYYKGRCVQVGGNRLILTIKCSREVGAVRGRTSKLNIKPSASRSKPFETYILA